MKSPLRPHLAASWLAVSLTIAGCGAPATPVAAPPAAAPAALQQAGPNVIDMKAADGGQLDVALQMPTKRKVMAFAEDVQTLKGKLSMGDKSLEFELTADEYGKAKVSFLNLLPGTWKLEVSAYDRGYQKVGYASSDVYVQPYEVAYSSLYLTLDETAVNKDTGALQADITTTSGYLDQDYESYPQWNQGDFPARGSSYKFKTSLFEGAYTAFNTDGAYGTWEGEVKFGLDKYGDSVLLVAQLDNGKRVYPLAKVLVSLDSYGNGAATDFIPLGGLSYDDLDMVNVSKAKDTEYIVTGYHKDPVKVQRYMVVDPETDEYGKPVGLMSSLYFLVDEYGHLGDLIAVDFTDKAGYVGSDPSPDSDSPDFKVVHIQALDK